MKFLYTSVLFILILVVQPVVGQNALILKKNKNGSIKHFRIGSKIYYKTSSDSTYIKAKIQEIKDSSIVFYLPEECEIPFREEKYSDITGIRKITALHSATFIAGSAILMAGAYIIFEANNIADETTIDESPMYYRAAGLVGIGLGLMPFAVKPKEYLIGAEYSIVNGINK